MKKYVIVVLLLAWSGAAYAANPADLTVFHRACPMHFSKVADDGNAWWASDTSPIGDKASFTLCQWQSDDDKTQLQIIPAASVTEHLDVALNVERWQGEENRQDIVLDFHRRNVGLGVWIPFQSDNEFSIGPRLKIKGFEAFATLSPSCKLYGLSYCESVRIDLAASDTDTWWFRASKQYGNYIPELRLKFTESESFIGAGIAYCFK